MLTYKNVLDSNNDIKMVRVFSEGRFAGTIEKMQGLDKMRWRYFPAGQRTLSGPSLDSIAEVKKTLEGE